MMRVLSVLLGTLMACGSCGPADLNVAEETGAVVEEEVVTELGVLEEVDCDQKALGSSVCDMVLYDQNDELWRLYEHRGKVVILDFSTAWCGPCQWAGHKAQPMQDEYGEDIVFTTILIDGLTSGVSPTPEEMAQWVSEHNVTTAPVLYGSREYVADPLGVSGYLIGGYPTYVILDQNLTIHAGVVGFNEELIRQLIDDLLQR